MAKKNEKQADAITFLNDIRSTFIGFKFVIAVMAVLAVVISLGATVLADRRADAAASNIYVLDEGSILLANRADNSVQRDLEVEDHVARFHELFFNLAPNINMINQNMERALELADKSAYDYFSDLKEEKYFSRIIDINATQQIFVDSMHVNVLKYPYEVETFASLYIMRESNISLYNMSSSCYVTDVERTRTNPHGLMITNYHATKPELVGTTTR